MNDVFTKEEIRAVTMQINARIIQLEELQEKETRQQNMEQARKIEGFLRPIRSAYKKLQVELHK